METKEEFEQPFKPKFQTLHLHIPNFIECESVERANKVDMTKYRLLERMSAQMSKFIFVKRQRQ